MLTAARDTAGRVHIAAAPDPGSAGLGAGAANAIQDLVSNVTGEVVTRAIDIYSRDSGAQTELDARLVPGVPTYIQIPYLAALFAGLICWGTVRPWWGKLFPASAVAAQQRSTSRAGRVVRELAFVLLFVPVAGLPAIVVNSLLQIMHFALAPVDWMRRKFLMRSAQEALTQSLAKD
jgi:hypothetical protein